MRLDLAAVTEAKLAHLRELVGGKDGQRVVPGVGDLITQGGLATSVPGDPMIVGDRGHNLANPAPKPRVQLVCGRVGPLKRVVQHACRDHVVGCSGLVKQRGDLDGMQNERRAVDLSPLAAVVPVGIGKRSPRFWQSHGEFWGEDGADQSWQNAIDSGNCESGDVLLLMSDAVASWYLQCFENDDLAAEDYFFTRPDNELIEFFDEERLAGRIRNDDVAIVRIEIKERSMG